MASTHLKNTQGNYKQQQQYNKHNINYKLFKYSQIPLNSKLPGLGMNPSYMIGGYYNNVLSNNTSDIESNLYGIGSTNLVSHKQNVKPSLNNLNEQKLFNKPDTLMPVKLCIEKYQRPIGPYTSS